MVKYENVSLFLDPQIPGISSDKQNVLTLR
jgi:hypothetical protein